MQQYFSFSKQPSLNQLGQEVSSTRSALKILTDPYLDLQGQTLILGRQEVVRSLRFELSPGRSWTWFLARWTRPARWCCPRSWTLWRTRRTWRRRCSSGGRPGLGGVRKVGTATVGRSEARLRTPQRSTRRCHPVEEEPQVIKKLLLILIGGDFYSRRCTMVKKEGKIDIILQARNVCPACIIVLKLW